MMLIDLIQSLQGDVRPVNFKLPDGSFVPAHYHLTEVGFVSKEFVDCGGTGRQTKTCALQVWVASDVEHRLNSDKFLGILKIAVGKWPILDLPVEVEYDQGNMAQYPVMGVEQKSNGIIIHLGSKHTECLAPDRCGVKGCC